MIRSRYITNFEVFGHQNLSSNGSTHRTLQDDRLTRSIGSFILEETHIKFNQMWIASYYLCINLKAKKKPCGAHQSVSSRLCFVVPSAFSSFRFETLGFQ